MYLGWGVNQVQGEESYYFFELQLTVQNYLLVFVAGFCDISVLAS